jgi:hypothetical protein
MGSALSPQQPPDELRRRAGALRVFATHIDNAMACGLGRLAGSDTWIGPAPTDCAADLRLIRIRFDGAAARLRDAARQLEAQAAAMPVKDGPR